MMTDEGMQCRGFVARGEDPMTCRRCGRSLLEHAEAPAAEQDPLTGRVDLGKIVHDRLRQIMTTDEAGGVALPTCCHCGRSSGLHSIRLHEGSEAKHLWCDYCNRLAQRYPAPVALAARPAELPRTAAAVGARQLGLEIDAHQLLEAIERWADQTRRVGSFGLVRAMVVELEIEAKRLRGLLLSDGE
jgi:hypothetical protein